MGNQSKNIHLLPTDKPSRLLRNGKELLLVDIPKIYTFFGCTISVNIYITSDEEIKEGDLGTDGTLLGYYGFDEDGCPILKNTKNNKVYEFGLAPYAKKIILTTDQDLIKDGVQAIDDEFLKWFVKNPSCEEVDIETSTFFDGKIAEYIIIIPKEEPKQETLEEVAKNYSERHQDVSENLGKYLVSAVFIDGAKWQQERSYSEEEVLEIIFKKNMPYMTDTEIIEWFNKIKKK